jgi:hypothetical protein
VSHANVALTPRAGATSTQRFVVGTPVVEQLPTDALLDGFHRPATTADRPALVGSWNGGRDDG